MAGIKLDEKPETQVAMVTLTEQPQGRSQNSGTGNSRGNRGNGGQRPENRNRRFKSNTDGSPVTECGFCSLIQSKEVSQEYITINFNERHRNVTHLSIWANNCLPWLKLSFDDWEKVLQNSELYCKVCLRPLRPGTKGSSCGRGKHILNTGFNGLCSIRECDRHSTLCRAHEEENKNRHKILKASLE